MPRKARDEKLDTRTARLRLAPRREPYWRNIQEGRAVGYRRLPAGKGGVWIARHYEKAEGRRYSALATADDMMDADGNTTLTFAQAQDKARDWFAEIERNGGRVVEPCTVGKAVEDYIADYTGRNGKDIRGLNRTINAHILPTFGGKMVTDLTFTELKAWHHRLAAAPVRLRTKKEAKAHNVRKIATGDANGQRARRSTANRVLTVLKAALNLAFREGSAPSDHAWRRVKPFAKVDAPRVRYLTDAEAVRLVNASGPDVRRIITAALLTGCRYAEITNFTARDFDPDGRVLHIRQTKAGKPRAMPMTEDAERFFTQATAGKSGDGLILVREDGAAWGPSHQFRPLREACSVAKITPAISFHILRHTFASRLAMKGVPISVVAAALGNSEAICAKHYAHLSPSYIADTIRQHAGGMGIVPENNVTPIRAAVA
jgi:integrase